MPGRDLGSLLRLLAVTPDDPCWRGAALARRVESLGRGGVSAIVFREKSLDDAGFRREILELERQLGERGPAIIVNERVELALEVGAAAVQLSYRSAPLAEVKTRVQGLLPVGISVHSVDEGLRRVDEGAEFLVFGPVFATPSKVGRVAVQGIPALAALCRAVSVPVVAIGGIEASEAASLRAAGAAGLAAIRPFFGTSCEPRSAAARFATAWNGPR